mgnify:CR=1 FL=1
MDYRFNMTPRLIAIAVIGFITLMALLFALGFQLGQQWATDEVRQHNAATASLQFNPTAPVTAFPTAPAVTLPASPITTAAPTLSPAGGAIVRPVTNPSVTLGRPN